MFARPGLCGMGVGRLGLVAASRPGLVAQALAILAKYGAAANLYLPGVGAISGITAGNWLDSAGTTAATVDNPVGTVVNACGGPNLVQSTSGNRPILRQSGGVYAWQFDGSNDSFASTLATGNEGWTCAGVRLSADVLATVANAGEGNATTKGFWLANIPSSGLMLATSNGSVRTQTFAPRPTLNTPVVVEAGWDSSSQFVSSHGFGTASSVRSGDCSSGGETLRIGDYRLGGFPFYGTIGATIIMPTVLPTASERATLRQFIASLSGVTM